jgi:hypothetical protein
MEKIVLAQIAYRAYGDWTEWKTPGGNPMLGWDELPMSIRNAWTAATESVAIEVRKDGLNTQARSDGS